jgi:hypothetical protein
MKINVITGDLFNDKNQFIKRMSCPKKETWDKLINDGKADSRRCSHCSQEVFDISKKTEAEIEQLVQQDPEVCFCIDLYNTHIKVIK